LWCAWDRKQNRLRADSKAGVEEVDTGQELTFGSPDELLKFLGDRFQAVSEAEPDNERDRISGTESRNNS